MELTPSVGMSFRRGGARLRALGKAHSPLHVMLWQAREAQNALTAAATAQKTLFNDIAAWASKENRALSDVCACASELSSIYTSAQMQIAFAYKSFRKDMKMILEGEKRSDAVQKKLQDAEAKRLKLRRQVLRIQNKRTQTGENPKNGDLTALQTQLSHAERTAERLHMESCDATREQEAVKLVLMRTALAKLSESHLALSSQIKLIFEAEAEITKELPDPPPPGDPLNGMVYAGHETTRAVLDRVKSQIQFSPAPLNTSGLSAFGGHPQYSSTPSTSPLSRQSMTPLPSAPVASTEDGDPPPPYNPGFFRSCCTRGEEGTSSSAPGKRSMEQSGGGKRIAVRRSLHGRATVTPDPSPSTSAGSIRHNHSMSPNNNPPQNPFYVQDNCDNCSGNNNRY